MAKMFVLNNSRGFSRTLDFLANILFGLKSRILNGVGYSTNSCKAMRFWRYFWVTEGLGAWGGPRGRGGGGGGGTRVRASARADHGPREHMSSRHVLAGYSYCNIK